MLGSQEAVRMCILSYPYYLSGSKPRMHSFEAVWWNSCSRLKHCARHSAVRSPKLKSNRCRRPSVHRSTAHVLAHESFAVVSATLADFSRARDSQITFSVTHG